MLTDAPVAVSLLFVAIVVGMLVLVLWGAARAAWRVGPGAVRGVRVAGMALVGWLALTGMLAERGFFDDFQSIPPRLVLALGPPLLTLLAVTFSRRIAPLLAALPPAWPVAAQTFRIPVEIVLWRLAVAGVIPELLSFTGRNVDILVGLTAPVVAYACFVRRAWPARVAVWWNWAGIVILLNVVVHAQLSAPTPWRLFETDPPTTFIADWPYIWLPDFLVPLAWLLHAVSLRQLRSRR
ncbi:MAG TPA: hypothetical protein VEP12_03760 [Candidatus Acidoferrum sp.]|jgi:hypothetical protein|nr:hypothetical protein [Candidatus Acidoferrum sp.]